VTGPDLEFEAAPEDPTGIDRAVQRIEAALGQLTGEVADQPLPVLADRLEELHHELQNALTSLDRA
jgi:hypothetical protein